MSRTPSDYLQVAIKAMQMAQKFVEGIAYRVFV